MRIAIILFKALCFRLSCSVAAGLIVFLFCNPLWGYIPQHHVQFQPSAVFLPADNYKNSLTESQIQTRSKDFFCKRGSKNKRFQKWQNLSPEERKKVRKRYKEWQSLPREEKQIIRQRMNELNNMPPQKRRLYKQLFRQWQHLPPKERKQIQNDLDNWENLSPQQQNSIRRRFK
jgi:hypothetical protein